MKVKQHSKNLNRQNLFWSLLPSLMFSIALGGYFFGARFLELNHQMERDAQVLVQAYGNAISNALAENDIAKLQSVCNYVLEHNNIRTIAVYSADGKRLAQTGPAMLPLNAGIPLLPQQYEINLPTPRYTESSLRMLMAVHDMPLVPQFSSRTNAPLQGWLEIEVEPTSILIEKYRSGLLVLCGILAVIALNAAVALRFSRQIHEAVENTRSVLARMIQGDIETTVEVNGQGEMRDLQTDLETLRNTILQGQRELQHSVDQATEDLRETLETIEIQNIELDLARKEALEASRIKSEFLANMSHEIRTPLNGVIGFTHLLLKTNVNTFQRDYLETILKSSESLLAIINDILDFSKIEAGKLALDQVPLNLQDLVEDVLTMLAPMAYEKHLEQVSLFYSDVPQQIIGDPLRLKQILTNLVNNAIKFTQRGEVIVRVMLEDLRNHLAVIKITVSDTGVGLTHEQQAALFHAFQQADNTTARRFGGTGLGLVISKHLVEQMRGQIGVESEAGQGSTFWFTFRAEIDIAEKAPSPLLDYPARMAIYDSNATLRATVRNQLEAREVSVIEFTELPRLLSAIDNEHFDALIIGINPEQPLYLDTTKVLCTADKLVPTLLLGNPADRHVIQEMLPNTTPPTFINKPVVERKLCDGLRQLLTPTTELIEATPTSKANQHISLSVIAVDDNPANLKLITALLEDLGVTVTPCDSGIRALELMESLRYDLILMDIQMPVMDGVETTKRIRNLEDGSRHTPIVAVTAHALASEKRHLLESGLDDYVTKPINEAQLLHIIRKWTGINLKQPAPITVPPTEESSTQPVDMALGIKLANGKKDLAEEMLQLLLKSLQQERSHMIALCAEKRYDQLLEAVHKLHGATRYTGVPRLQQAARALEENLKLKQYQDTAQLFEHLVTEIAKVEAWQIEQAVS